MFDCDKNLPEKPITASFVSFTAFIEAITLKAHHRA
jgi:hypothetical protein